MDGLVGEVSIMLMRRVWCRSLPISFLSFSPCLLSSFDDSSDDCIRIALMFTEVGCLYSAIV
jgi:hypothetical protein